MFVIRFARACALNWRVPQNSANYEVNFSTQPQEARLFRSSLEINESTRLRVHFLCS